MELVLIPFAVLLGIGLYLYFKLRARRRNKATFMVRWIVDNKIVGDFDEVTGVDELLDKNTFFAQAKERGKDQNWIVDTDIETDKLGKFGRRFTVKVTTRKGRVKILTYEAIQI